MPRGNRPAATRQFAGHDGRTVAVESADLDAVREVRRMLELDGYDNVSYPRAIRHTLGGRFAER